MPNVYAAGYATLQREFDNRTKVISVVRKFIAGRLWRDLVPVQREVPPHLSVSSSEKQMTYPISANRKTVITMNPQKMMRMLRGRRPQPGHGSDPDASRLFGVSRPSKKEAQGFQDEEVALSSA